MSIESFPFKAGISRRLPDPNFKTQHGTERFLLVTRAKDLPVGLPDDPNARRPNLNKRVYKEVRQSLLGLSGDPGTFHLKNKGITLIAKSVRQKGNDEYEVDLESGVHGIVDGGHTYKIICECQESGTLPDDQFVTVEIRVGIPTAWIPDIAGGLNTSVQVEDMSLDNLGSRFDWIKNELRTAPFFPTIAWSENDPGEYDARDIVSLLLCLNVELFPNSADEHPLAAYVSKASALKVFEQKGDSFQRMRPILREALELYETIAFEARDMWNSSNAGGKAGHLSIIESKKNGPFDFPFIGKQGEFRLKGGALLPVFAAFRWFVETNPSTNQMGWRGGFGQVMSAWKRDGADLLKATQQKSLEVDRNINMIGKSRVHWSSLHSIVAKRDLENRMAQSD